MRSSAVGRRFQLPDDWLAVLSDPELLHLAGGIRVVCQCLLDGPSDLSPLIATGLIYVLDSPRLRQFIRPGLDLEVCPSVHGSARLGEC